MEVVEWSARLARKRAFRVRRLLATLRDSEKDASETSGVLAMQMI